MSELLHSASELVDTPMEILERARALDRHYIPTRYPDAYPAGAPYTYYTRHEADEAVRNAREVIRFCKDGLA